MHLKRPPLPASSRNWGAISKKRFVTLLTRYNFWLPQEIEVRRGIQPIGHKATALFLLTKPDGTYTQITAHALKNQATHNYSQSSYSYNRLIKEGFVRPTITAPIKRLNFHG